MVAVHCTYMFGNRFVINISYGNPPLEEDAMVTVPCKKMLW